jgi:glutamyl-tRNA synthetase
MAMYREALQQLAYERKVFACTCSRRQLSDAELCTCFNRQIPLTTENASWRLITWGRPEPVVKNYYGKVICTALPAEMYDFVVKKKDGFPAYQLTSVIDDLFYGVDFVVRGEDLWPSTLAQHALASALGRDNFADIAFYQHPLLMEAPGKKLSKSAGATSIKYLRESGKSPASVYQLIASIMGIKETVVSWQQLGEIAAIRNPGQQNAH